MNFAMSVALEAIEPAGAGCTISNFFGANAPPSHA